MKVETDVTKHDMEKHSGQWAPHTQNWYELFDKKCPACGLTPEYVEDTTVPMKLGLKVKGLSSGEGLHY